jgi:hypothetical protein
LLVVVAIISVLIAMLLPALSSARDQAKSAICLSNERQIYLKFVEYFNEYNNELPPGYSYDGTKYTYWLDYIKLASSNWADVEKNQGRYPPCPSIPAKKYPPPESIMGGGYVKGDYPNFTYAMNLAFTEPWWKVHKIDRISRPSETLLIMDNLLIFVGDYSHFTYYLSRVGPVGMKRGMTVTMEKPTFSGLMEVSAPCQYINWLQVRIRKTLSTTGGRRILLVAVKNYDEWASQ